MSVFTYTIGYILRDSTVPAELTQFDVLGCGLEEESSIPDRSSWFFFLLHRHCPPPQPFMGESFGSQVDHCLPIVQQLGVFGARFTLVHKFMLNYARDHISNYHIKCPQKLVTLTWHPIIENYLGNFQAANMFRFKCFPTAVLYRSFRQICAYCPSGRICNRSPSFATQRHVTLR